jgi:hypothetical protein
MRKHGQEFFSETVRVQFLNESCVLEAMEASCAMPGRYALGVA